MRPGVGEAVLRQVADRQVGRLDDAAGVRLVEPGQHLEQRRLAGAVRPAQADAIAVADLPGDVVEQRAVAEGLGEVRELDHASGSTRNFQLPTPNSSQMARASRRGIVLGVRDWRWELTRASGRRSAQRFGGGGEHLRDAERLREIAGDAEVDRFDGARLGREAGDDDDRQVRR